MIQLSSMMHFADQQCTMIEVASSSSTLEFNEAMDVDNMFVPLCLHVVGGVEEISEPFSVELVKQDFSTATLGEDIQYGIGLPGSSHQGPATTSLFIDFAAGTVLRSCGIVSILPDDKLEEPEVYMLQLSGSTPYDIPINPDQDSFTIHIVDTSSK